MAARKTKPKSPDSQAQPDPKAPLDSAALLKSATPVLKLLAADLLARADNSLSITTALKLRHGKEKSEERTADNYDIWRRDFVEQVAAAWFLSCVFVRTLEDRGLIDRNRLAGPGAEDSQRAFFALVPSLNERDYLLTVFRELQQLPAARELFDARHNPVWLLGRVRKQPRNYWACFAILRQMRPCFGLAMRIRGSWGSLPRYQRERSQALRAAANPAFRRAVHPGPHAGPSHRTLRSQ